MSAQLINTDVLLEYLSIEMPYGKWQDFRNCIDKLNYSDEYVFFTQYSDMFSRLGHIEFDFDNQGNGAFAVCKPTLGVTKNSNYGILSGFRTTELIENLKNEFEVLELYNNIAPKCIKINIKGKLNIFKQRFPHIRISKNFAQKAINIAISPQEYIKTLEKLDNEPIYNAPNVKIYDTDFCRFIKPNKKIDGLYEQDHYSYKRYFLYTDNIWYEINKDYGKIYVSHLENADILKYANNVLSIRKNAGIPKLIDKAITSKSGMNPTERNYFLEYREIDFDFAQKVAQKLGLSIN